MILPWKWGRRKSGPESREYLEEARQIAGELGAEKLSARITAAL